MAVIYFNNIIYITKKNMEGKYLITICVFTATCFVLIREIHKDLKRNNQSKELLKELRYKKKHEHNNKM